MEITFFPNGMTMAFDENGEQVPVAQMPWLRCYAQYLSAQGIDPTKQTYTLPDGRRVRAFAVEGGFNFEDDGWQIWSREENGD